MQPRVGGLRSRPGRPPISPPPPPAGRVRRTGERRAGGRAAGTAPERARRRGQGWGAAGGRGRGGDTCGGAAPAPPRPSAGIAGAAAPAGCRLGVPPCSVPARECSVPTGSVSAAGVASPPRQPPPSSSRGEAAVELVGPAGGALAMGLEPGSAAGRRRPPPGWCRPLRAPRGGYRNPSGRGGVSSAALAAPPPARCCRGFSCAAPEAAGRSEPHRRAGLG